MLKRHIIFIFSLLSMLWLSTGCQITGNSSNQNAKLAGTSWRLAGWSASSLYPAQFEITAKFSESDISGKSAVNSYGGSYRSTEKGDFSVGDLQTTLMAGAEEAMRAEAIYIELLQQARQFSVDSTILTLADANGNQLLIFNRQ